MTARATAIARVPATRRGERIFIMRPILAQHHYSRFRVSERLLLTGHSHQAWPDVGFEAQQRAWLDAAEYVDEKWAHAETQAARVRAGFTRLLNDRDGHIAPTYAYPVKVNGRYVTDPSPTPKFDNPKMNDSPALQLFGAGREKRIYAIPPYT